MAGKNPSIFLFAQFYQRKLIFVFRLSHICLAESTKTCEGDRAGDTQSFAGYGVATYVRIRIRLLS
jgi:hypothetical protein